MPGDPSVVENLLRARDGLVRERDRLNAAIQDIDSLIGGIGGGEHGATGTGPLAGPARGPAARPARAMGSGLRPKSIRIAVLDILARENRAFGFTEVIELVRAAGLQAHDDAVRSITVKLMKAGKVERIGRGQYRLAGSGADIRQAAPGDGPSENSPTPAVSFADRAEPAAEHSASDRPVSIDQPRPPVPGPSAAQGPADAHSYATPQSPDPQPEHEQTWIQSTV